MLQLWKSIVIPRLDYCSYWSPHHIGFIQQLRRAFIKRISGCQDKTYHEALKELGLYSLERRRERYQIMYLWCILEKRVPNIKTSSTDLIKIHSQMNSRKGRTVYIAPLGQGRIANLRFHSLPFRGARLFNCLPKRNVTDCSKDRFKSMLDEYLKSISDIPLLQSNYPCRRTASNSILDMSKMVKQPNPYGPRWKRSTLVGCR